MAKVQKMPRARPGVCFFSFRLRAHRPVSENEVLSLWCLWTREAARRREDTFAFPTAKLSVILYQGITEITLSGSSRMSQAQVKKAGESLVEFLQQNLLNCSLWRRV